MLVTTVLLEASLVRAAGSHRHRAPPRSTPRVLVPSQACREEEQPQAAGTACGPAPISVPTPHGAVKTMIPPILHLRKLKHKENEQELVQSPSWKGQRREQAQLWQLTPVLPSTLQREWTPRRGLARTRAGERTRRAHSQHTLRTALPPDAAPHGN